MQTSFASYAGFLSRLLAQIVDAVVLLLSLLVVTLLVGALAGRNSPVMGASSLVVVLFAIFYYVYFASEGRQTFGKRIAHIKIMKEDGNKPLTLKEAFCREILFRSACHNFLGLGYLWIIWDTKKQGWHDKIAGTVVVKV